MKSRPIQIECQFSEQGDIQDILQNSLKIFIISAIKISAIKEHSGAAADD